MLVIHPKDKTTAMLSALSDQFARADGLYGLFTEMIDSEESEALLYQIDTLQEVFKTVGSINFWSKAYKFKSKYGFLSCKTTHKDM